MKESIQFTGRPKLNRYVNIALGLLASGAMLIIFHWIGEKIDQSRAMILSIGFTACFISGVYIGRYIAHLWVNSNIYVRNGLLIFLPLVVFIMILLSNAIMNKILTSTNPEHYYGPSKTMLLFVVFFIMAAATGVLIKMIRARIQDRIKAAEANAAHSQSELQLLQSQLSPHFLFNTLNNLYGISMTEHEKIPALLLRLSDLLRYSVYDAKELFVPLKDEISYLKNYIEFEKIRIGNRLELKVEVDDVADATIKIAPMLLIVFVENAFKHSKNTSQQKIVINIELKIWSNSILFLVQNSYSKANIEIANAESSGMGLTNVKKRLELLYANAYDLKIDQTPEIFTVMLRVNAK